MQLLTGVLKDFHYMSTTYPLRKSEKLWERTWRTLFQGDDRDVEEFFAVYSEFFRRYGYDVVTLRPVSDRFSRAAARWETAGWIR